MDAKIKFPVLYFCYGGTRVFTETDEENLTRVNAAALSNNYFEDFFIVDSEGKGFSVRAAEKIGYVPPLWGWRLFRGRQIKVSLELDGPTQFTLDAFKDRVSKVIDGDADFWSSTTGSHENIKTNVRKAKSFKEVIQRLS